jgi:hypothetical protein
MLLRTYKISLAFLTLPMFYFLLSNFKRMYVSTTFINPSAEREWLVYTVYFQSPVLFRIEIGGFSCTPISYLRLEVLVAARLRSRVKIKRQVVPCT